MKSKVLITIVVLSLGCSEKRSTSSTDYSTEVISEARPFAAGIISTEANSEFQIMFTPDGQKAYFSRRAPEEKQKLFETNFENGVWTEPVICSFSTDRDETPSISNDGEYFFFGSDRPIPDKPNKGNFDMNIWMMKKTEFGWGVPQPLPFPINDVQVEGEEWPSSNNNFLSQIGGDKYYFTTMVRGTNAMKLFETKFSNGEFSQPTEIKGLFDDEKYWVYSPVVSADGNYLVFNSFGAPGGFGGEDIFVAKRTPNGWSKAVSIGVKVNSKDEESGPRFSRDGKYFFFNRAKDLGNYEYGEWDIFYIETEFLQLEDLFK